MNILFHYPGPMHDVLDAGEKIRPQMMLRAFAELGHEVVPVCGTLAQRRAQITELAGDLNRFDFMYSENSTLPLRLCSGGRHLPAIPSPDFQLFRMAHHNEIPIGVFYRDVYWKFAGFRQQIGIAKHITSIPFYIEELRLYRNTATNIFVPSGEFSALLPDSLRFRCHPMPPGLLIHKIGKRCTDERLRLFYVGNIKPPFYDLSPAIDAMRQLSDLPIRLTVCTRRTEVEAYASHYRWPPNTTIVHLIGKDLNEVLRESDIFLMCFKPDSYRKIAMPLKLFEAIAFGLPVIATGPTAVSQFVKMEQTGWEIEPSGLTELLRHILANREEIESYRKRILAFRKLHSWKARALQVCKILNRDKM